MAKVIMPRSSIIYFITLIVGLILFVWLFNIAPLSDSARGYDEGDADVYLEDYMELLAHADEDDVMRFDTSVFFNMEVAKRPQDWWSTNIQWWNDLLGTESDDDTIDLDDVTTFEELEEWGRRGMEFRDMSIWGRIVNTVILTFEPVADAIRSLSILSAHISNSHDVVKIVYGGMAGTTILMVVRSVEISI